MSPATKELMKLALVKRMAYGGHSVLKWMMDNIYARTDSAGNVKPDKEKSTENVEGAVDLIMALDRSVRNKNNNSLYNNSKILILEYRICLVKFLCGSQ